MRKGIILIDIGRSGKLKRQRISLEQINQLSQELIFDTNL